MFFIAIKNGHILGLCPPLGPLWYSVVITKTKKEVPESLEVRQGAAEVRLTLRQELKCE